MRNRIALLVVVVVIVLLWVAGMLAARRSPAGIGGDGYTWKRTGLPIEDGVASRVAVGGSGLAFVGSSTDGWICRTTDGGNHWKNASSGIKRCYLYALAIAPSGSVFAGTGRGIYRSTDNGEHWTLVGAGRIEPSVVSVTVGPKGWICAGTDRGGLFYSTDDGNHWKSVESPGSGRIDSTAVDSSGCIFAGVRSGAVMRSTDGGARWKRVWSPAAKDDTAFEDITAPGRRELFVLVRQHDDRLLHSTDNGTTWTMIAKTGRFSHWQDCAVTSGGDVILATRAGLMRLRHGSGRLTPMNAVFGSALFAHLKPSFSAVDIGPDGSVCATSRLGVFYGTPVGRH